MQKITKRISVRAPVDKVWCVLADFGDVATWAPAVMEAHCTTANRSGIGCTRSVTASNGAIVEEIVTARDEGHGLTFEIPRGLAGVIRFLSETWSVEATGHDTEVVVCMAYRARLGAFGAALVRLAVRPILARMLEANVAGLKRYVENGQVTATNS